MRYILFVKIIALIAVTSLPFYLKGQSSVNQGTVTYSVAQIEGSFTDYQNNANPRLPLLLEKASTSLRFKDDLAVFGLDDNGKLAPHDLTSVARFIGVSTDRFYWQDFHNAYYFSKANQFIPKDYLVSMSFTEEPHTPWDITEETKEIAGYLCYKATQYETRQNGSRVLIIAWFCPEIPVPFGPKAYGGLPGLILALQNDARLFGATRISFERVDDIPPLPDYEIMPDIEYYGKIQEVITERKRQKKQ